jgi:putative transposase
VPARKHNVEEIVATLREIERLTDNGMSVSAAAKSLGITDQTFYRWRTRYGSLPEDDAKRLQALDEENARLKRVIAEQSQDVTMLQDLTQGEILSAARRREAVEYLVHRYRISERRACRLVGQHRSTQRYGGSGRDENEPLNGSAAQPATNGELRRTSGGWTGPSGRVSEFPNRPSATGGRIPFLDDRVPCLGRVRTSVLHDLVWLARDSEMARLFGANAVIRRIEYLATTPNGLVRKFRGQDSDHED